MKTQYTRQEDLYLCSNTENVYIIILGSDQLYGWQKQAVNTIDGFTLYVKSVAKLLI